MILGGRPAKVPQEARRLPQVRLLQASPRLIVGVSRSEPIIAYQRPSVAQRRAPHLRLEMPIKVLLAAITDQETDRLDFVTVSDQTDGITQAGARARAAVFECM